MRVAVFTTGIGTNRFGASSGSTIVPFNLAKSAARHLPDLEIDWFVQYAPSGWFAEQLGNHGVSVTPINPERMTREFLGSYDVVHELNSRTRAMKLGSLGLETVVIGPNVIAETPGIASSPDLKIQREEEKALLQYAGNFKLVLTLNPELEAILAQRFCISCERVLRFPTGIDTELFKPERPYSERRKVVWFGKATSGKKGSDIAYRLREAFKKHEFVFPVEKSVVKYQDIPNFYRDAGILISASAHETQGLATMEAAASGLAVLQSYLLRQRDGKEVQVQPWFVGPGYAVFPREYRSFEDRLKRLLSDANLAEKMGRENRRWVEEVYSLETMACQYGQILETAVKMPKPVPFSLESPQPTTASRRGGNVEDPGAQPL